MLSQDSLEADEVRIYKMLSDSARLNVLKLLMKKDMCVSEIVDSMELPQSLVSHKLKELRENGLVTSHRSGKKIIYRLGREVLAGIIQAGEKAGQTLPWACNCVECGDATQA